MILSNYLGVSSGSFTERGIHIVARSISLGTEPMPYSNPSRAKTQGFFRNADALSQAAKGTGIFHKTFSGVPTHHQSA